MDGSKAFANASIFQINVVQSKDRKYPRIIRTKFSYSYSTIGSKLLFEKMNYLFKDYLVDQMC
jgi:hypothetical protein